jgi:hypothetical protein
VSLHLPSGRPRKNFQDFGVCFHGDISLDGASLNVPIIAKTAELQDLISEKEKGTRTFLTFAFASYVCVRQRSGGRKLEPGMAALVNVSLQDLTRNFLTRNFFGAQGTRRGKVKLIKKVRGSRKIHVFLGYSFAAAFPPTDALVQSQPKVR